MNEIKIPEQIDNAELLYRGVIPDQWKEDEGKPSTSVFKSRSGASVDRDVLTRSEKECVEFLLAKKPNLKAVCSISAQKARTIGTYPIYKPSQVDVFHSEIHDSEEKVVITASTKLFELTTQSKVIMITPKQQPVFIQGGQSNTERNGEQIIQNNE